MATEDTLLSIGDKFKISPTTVMNIVNRILYFLLKVKNTYISFPNTEEELTNVSQRFVNYPGFPGSAHDSRVFENSLLFRQIEMNEPNYIFYDDHRVHLIRDSAFPLKSWLMKPYTGNNLSRKQRQHNYILSSDRVAIEHTFGILRGRWRRSCKSDG